MPTVKWICTGLRHIVTVITSNLLETCFRPSSIYTLTKTAATRVQTSHSLLCFPDRHKWHQWYCLMSCDTMQFCEKKSKLWNINLQLHEKVRIVRKVAISFLRNRIARCKLATQAHWKYMCLLQSFGNTHITYVSARFMAVSTWNVQWVVLKRAFTTWLWPCFYYVGTWMYFCIFKLVQARIGVVQNWNVRWVRQKLMLYRVGKQHSPLHHQT